jgi:amino acid transporter
MTKLQPKTLTWIWAVLGCLAILSVSPLLSVCDQDGPCGVLMLMGFGGLLLSAMVSNLHDPNVVLAVLFNWIIFALVAIAVAKFRKHRRGEPTA